MRRSVFLKFQLFFGICWGFKHNISLTIIVRLLISYVRVYSYYNINAQNSRKYWNGVALESIQMPVLQGNVFRAIKDQEWYSKHQKAEEKQ